MVKNPSVNEGDTRDTDLISGPERPLLVGNGQPLQDSCLENSTDRGAWKAIVRGLQRAEHD